MLDGIDLEDKENVTSVTSVIKAVLDGVKVSSFGNGDNVNSVYFFGATEAPFVFFPWTGTGETDDREAGATITHLP